MDADGDFVVVWASEGQDADGSWGVYAQRFNALGSRLGQRVPRQYDRRNDQVSPAVAMDAHGDFVVGLGCPGQSLQLLSTASRGKSSTAEATSRSESPVNSQNVPARD